VRCAPEPGRTSAAVTLIRSRGAPRMQACRFLSIVKEPGSDVRADARECGVRSCTISPKKPPRSASAESPKTIIATGRFSAFQRDSRSYPGGRMGLRNRLLRADADPGRPRTATDLGDGPGGGRRRSEMISDHRPGQVGEVLGTVAGIVEALARRRTEARRHRCRNRSQSGPAACGRTGEVRRPRTSARPNPVRFLDGNDGEVLSIGGNVTIATVLCGVPYGKCRPRFRLFVGYGRSEGDIARHGPSRCSGGWHVARFGPGFRGLPALIGRAGPIGTAVQGSPVQLHGNTPIIEFDNQLR
jgi:hypothetical protein